MSSPSPERKTRSYELEQLERRGSAEPLPSRSSAAAVEYTEEEETKIIRKLDYRLLPFLFLLYTFAVLDRSNLGMCDFALCRFRVLSVVWRGRVVGASSDLIVPYPLY